jgi:hypothetical protein
MIYFRPSLPDVSEELVGKYEEYQQGFFKISTDELLSTKYLDFW